MKNICPFLKEKHPEKNVENILLMLEYEFFLINVLNYEFYVFCPYKAMRGFLNEFKRNQESTSIGFLDEDKLREFESTCESIIDRCFMTDIIFIYTYSQIALSCILITAENFKLDLITFGSLLNIEDHNLRNFIDEILPRIKESLTDLKIITYEIFEVNKKKILKFLIRNPRYIEKIEKDREYY